jgi:hypothetical protein
MSILPKLEQDLIAAAAARGGASPDPSRPRLRGRRRRWTLLAVAVLLLASATIALAASGVILTGAPVSPGGQPSPGVGVGVPAAGSSRLLSLRVPDPEGGPPWGMRILGTTRGLVCVQVGRVVGGQLGELGIDGAFHNDGRLHQLRADVLPTNSLSSSTANSSCHAPGETFTQEVHGLDRSAAGELRSSPRPQLRDVFYAVLGAHALGITYTEGASQRTIPVEPSTGAYLIVQTTTPHEQLATGGGSAAARGVAEAFPISPTPPLSAITYRIRGRTCVQRLSSPIAGSCFALPPPHEVRLPRTRRLNLPVRVQLRLRNGHVAAARVSFRAPFAVTTAARQYAVAIPSPCHLGTAVQPVDHNVRAGSLVGVTLIEPFANACGPTLTVDVLYSGRFSGVVAGVPGVVTVGSTSVELPAGTRP